MSDANNIRLSDVKISNHFKHFQKILGFCALSVMYINNASLSNRILCFFCREILASSPMMASPGYQHMSRKETGRESRTSQREAYTKDSKR